MTSSVRLLVKYISLYIALIIYLSDLCIIFNLSIFSSYDLMLSCWKIESSDRPTFVEIKEYLEGLIESKMSSACYLALPTDPPLEG